MTKRWKQLNWPWTPCPIEAEKHLELAANLQHDGLFEWAESEYRHVAEQVDEEPSEALRAQLYLSELLHDIANEKAAGEVLRELGGVD